ncbi:hypothetical protein HHK36_028461 [Tetracentron sinense]|uniref:FAS1 domain-containing protein n=1 Tax=Tetracentron sinense TaxID=13715 RepID=A0A834YDG1_TETSI|nr:hypothetical protein HHK36_028461 [Tetracentron sinense]
MASSSSGNTRRLQFSLSNSGQINSNSVLVALLDSHYTELSELVEKALLLQTPEDAVGKHNITIFAPRNEALERDLDPEFKRFLLEPGNLRSLQTLLMFHIIPNRIWSNEWPMTDAESTRHKTLFNDHLHLTCKDSDKKTINLVTVIHPDAVIRPNGVIHGGERLLVPRSVQEDFNRRRNLRSISAVLPEGALRTNRLKKPATPVSTGLPSVLLIFDAMALGLSLAPALTLGPSGPHHHFDGESQMLVSSPGDESSMVREASMAALKDIAITGIPFWFWIVAPPSRTTVAVHAPPSAS